jgi:hypothetical protein
MRHSSSVDRSFARIHALIVIPKAKPSWRFVAMLPFSGRTAFVGRQPRRPVRSDRDTRDDNAQPRKQQRRHMAGVVASSDQTAINRTP